MHLGKEKRDLGEGSVSKADRDLSKRLKLLSNGSL
jgi:hypothetical protein